MLSRESMQVRPDLRDADSLQVASDELEEGGEGELAEDYRALASLLREDPGAAKSLTGIRGVAHLLKRLEREDVKKERSYKQADRAVLTANRTGWFTDAKVLFLMTGGERSAMARRILTSDVSPFPVENVVGVWGAGERLRPRELIKCGTFGRRVTFDGLELQASYYGLLFRRHPLAHWHRAMSYHAAIFIEGGKTVAVVMGTTNR